MALPSSPMSYQVGGSLPAEFPGYVERHADQELFEHLLAGRYCFVFNSRQMGKSSLRVRTMRRLQAEGHLCAEINPQVRGITLNEEQWYAGTIKRLIEDLALEHTLEFRSWWRECQSQSLTAVERFYEFIDQILLPATTAPVVIFVEEVDNLLSLSFDTDGFFALIRSLHEQRAQKPEFRRLSFVFLGVATPYDLIRHEQGSAFNIGHAVEMAGFSLAEARPLLTGLNGRVADPEGVLARVIHWSGGQPFLTQKLLDLLLQSDGPAETTEAWVERTVRQGLIDNWETQDNPPHLRTIRDRLLAGGEQGRGRLLGLYQQVLGTPEGVPMEDTAQHRQLRLTGLVSLRKGRLHLANPLYGEVFDEAWVQRELADMRPTIYGEALRAWKAAGRSDGIDQKRHLIGGAALTEAQEWARDKLLSAEDQAFLQACMEAEEAARKAEQTALLAAEQARLAEERALRAELETTRAKELASQAEKDKQLAQRNARNRRRLVFGLSLGVMALGGLSGYAIVQQQAASNNERRALLGEQRAQEAQGRARNDQGRAERALVVARTERSNAERQAMEADRQKKKADAQKIQAEKARHSEAEQRREAQEQTELARSQSRRANAQTAIARLREQVAQVLRQMGSKPVEALVQAIVLSTQTQQASHRESIEGKGVDILTQATDGVAETHRLLGHQGWVTSVAFSPDEKRIASASEDGTIRVWDAMDGKPIWSFRKGHEARVNAVAFSPDGRRLVSASNDKTLRVWDASSGKPIGSPLKGHNDGVSAVAFSPDGRRIVSGSHDFTLRLWDAASGRLIGEPLKGHTFWVSSLAFNPKGDRIVSGSGDNTVRLWEANSGKPIGDSIEGHDGYVMSVAFSQDGTKIASGSTDKTIRIWDVHSKKTVQILRGHRSQVASVAFSPTGTWILSGSNDGTIRFWDVRSGDPVGDPLQGHEGDVFAVAFSQKGTRIVSGSEDKTVRLWNAPPFIGYYIDMGDVHTVAISPDGKRILSGGRYGMNLRIGDWDSGRSVQRIKLNGHGNTVASAAFSPDGRRIASASWDGTVRIWDANTGQPIGSPLIGHEDAVNAVAFSPDGRRIASASADKTLRLWDAATGKTIGSPLIGHEDAVNAVAFSPDGRRIASASADKTLRLWDAATGKTIGPPLKGHSHHVMSVAFSPDGTRLVSGSYDFTLRLWDVASGRPIGPPLRGHSDGIYAAVFSPDGQRIASSSEDNTLRLWDASTGKPLGPLLQGHTDMVFSMAFSPDGTHLVSGSADDTVHLWDANSVDYLTLACQRLSHHQLLLRPETYTTNQELRTMARKAHKICSRQAPEERDRWLQGVLKPLAQLTTSLRDHLGPQGGAG